MGEFGSEYQYPDQRNPSSKPLLGGQNVGPTGSGGADAVFVVSQANNILIPSDDDGGNPVYTNAINDYEIWQGNTLLATKSVLDGWTSQVINENNVTIDDTTDLEATVTAISADEGDFTMQFDKVGFNSLIAKIYVKKAKSGTDGNTGNTGNTGSTGATGPAGPTGANGTGLVVVRKTISMVGYTSLTLTADDSDGLRFTSTVPHLFNMGDTVFHVMVTHNEYDGYHKISEIIDSTHYRIATVSYVGDDTGYGLNKSKLISEPNSNPQDLEWYGVIPSGAALMEVRLIMTAEDNGNELYAYMGWERNPTAGWNFYINGELFEQVGDQRPYPAISSDYSVWRVRGTVQYPDRGDIHLRLTPYASNNWNTDYTNVEFVLTIAYINFEVSESSSIVQYLPTFGDGTAQGRIGVRNGKVVRDKTLTPTGFSGTEGVDWYNIDAH